MTTAELRPELPELPDRLRRLPIDHRGYPVPFFAAWSLEGAPAARGRGTADHRYQHPGAQAEAIRKGLCWICGRRIHGLPGSTRYTFLVGPMCIVNRTSAEPPMHDECADWSARACPFLTRPHARRRTDDDPDTAPGKMLRRNPGVMAVWTTTRYHIRDVGNGLLLRFGDPVDVRWYAEGRPATRAEVETSIETGLPALREAADRDAHPADARAELERLLEQAEPYLPAAA